MEPADQQPEDLDRGVDGRPAGEAAMEPADEQPEDPRLNCRSDEMSSPQ
jgi:hypothetical protein